MEKKKRIILYIVIIAALIFGSVQMYKSGKIGNMINVAQSKCSVDADCACGTHAMTGECFVGNKNFVAEESQCPDYCSGVAGNFETKCLDGKCTFVNKI